MTPELKYGGEALTLTWLAFRLLRWAWGAVSEGDAPPSADIANPLTIGDALMGNAEERLQATLSDSTHPHDVSASLQVVDPSAFAGDPALFPPEMLAAMTPEQRARIMKSLANQRAKGTAA